MSYFPQYLPAYNSAHNDDSPTAHLPGNPVTELTLARQYAERSLHHNRTLHGLLVRQMHREGSPVALTFLSELVDVLNKQEQALAVVAKECASFCPPAEPAWKNPNLLPIQH